MIHGVFGKLGSGKGLLVMDIIFKELMDGFRDVVTNVPIRIVPWVNGQGLPQIGLRAYLFEKLGPAASDDFVDEILKRVLVIEDIDKGPDLFMWRRDGDTGEWFKLEVTKTDEKGRPERFDANQIKIRHCAPVLCVTDEAWQFYPNNGGWARVPLLPFYARQQRKLRDEWYIVTQHPTDVDTVLWNIAQDFWVCRNHGMERMGMFRQPSLFRVIVYLTNPAKGNAIRSMEFYRRLDRKLSQCYDTTAGVGINGGFAGDSNQKKKGLHVGWLVAAVILLVGMLALVPHILGKGASAWIGHTISPPASAAKWAGIKSKSTAQAPAQSAPATPLVPSSADGTNQVTCVGWVKVNDEYIVFLSDGSDYSSKQHELDWIQTRKVSILGRVYNIVPRPATCDYQPVAPAPVDMPPPAPVADEVNPVQVTVIGERQPLPQTQGSFPKRRDSGLGSQNQLRR